MKKEPYIYLPPHLALAAKEVCKNEKVSEIRLAPDRKVFIFADKPFYLTKEGTLSENRDEGIFLKREEFYKIFERMCESSPYARQESLKYGFLTLSGGHRVGVCGRAILKDGAVFGLRDISGLNIRISRQIFTAADGIIDHVAPYGKIKNTLIISPPGFGKTTALREIARLLGGGKYFYRVGIMDERCEIAGGAEGYDTGELSFVYSGCKKAEGMLMAIRSMAPDVIICDEVGGDDDGEAIFSLINAGVKVICSCHGYGKDDVLRRGGIKKLFEKGIFECTIILKGRGKTVCF